MLVTFDAAGDAFNGTFSSHTERLFRSVADDVVGSTQQKSQDELRPAFGKLFDDVRL